MNLMSYIPKSKIEAIRDVYKDEDGYWICLNEGWEASRTDSGCRTIHEDTIKDLRYQIAGIQRVTSKEPEAEETVISGNMKEMALKEEREAEITEEPDPDEYRKIQDSMTESFYEFCTGEPAPENWKEIIAEEKGEQAHSQVSPELLTVPSQITPPAPIKSGPSAAEAVGFGIFMALAYTVWIAKGVAELLILALQMLYITITPVVFRASERLWKAWLRIYPEIVPTACRTARIAAKQAAIVVWWLWVVVA